MDLIVGLLKLLFPSTLLQPLLKPVARLMIGLIAIPFFRICMRRVVRVQDLDQELERDLELWFRGAILLLVATANMESQFFSWVPPNLRDEKGWLLLAGRLLLAIGVIEGMPDQALFAIIHPGPPKLNFNRRKPWTSFRQYLWPAFKGFLCQHLNRSSPVLAILAVTEVGIVGWVCYWMAISQYLLIGLVTSRDRAIHVLTQFDQAVKVKRAELDRQLHEDEGESWFDDEPASAG